MNPFFEVFTRLPFTRNEADVQRACAWLSGSDTMGRPPGLAGARNESNARHAQTTWGIAGMPMRVTVEETRLPGVLLVKAGIARDARGFFSEIYSQPAFAEAGLDAPFVQDNLGLSAKGIFRGLHYQLEPFAMGKLVRAIRGAVFDVVVDLRAGSPTFGQWLGVTLTEENHLALWAPPGFAHGFLTLEDQTLFHYKCTQVHTPGAERSVRYDDPAIGIQLPMPPALLSEKDAKAPLLKDAEFNFRYHD